MSIGPISDSLHRQLFTSTDKSSRIMEPIVKSITPTNHRHLLQTLYIIHTYIIHATYFSRMVEKHHAYRPHIRLVPAIP